MVAESAAIVWGVAGIIRMQVDNIQLHAAMAITFFSDEYENLMVLIGY